MFKVEYEKLAILENGDIGNIVQGYGTAYLDCHISEIDELLSNQLIHDNVSPVIGKVTKIKGHIVYRK